MFHGSSLRLLFCCIGLISPSHLTATETSPYSLYLKLKHQFLHEDKLQNTEDWMPLFQQAFLPISTLESLSDRWIIEAGWTPTWHLLSHQIHPTNPNLEPLQKWSDFLHQQHAASLSHRDTEHAELLHPRKRSSRDSDADTDAFQRSSSLPSDSKIEALQYSLKPSLNDSLAPFLHFQKNQSLGEVKNRDHSLLKLKNYAQSLLQNPPNDFSPSHPSFYYLIDFSVLTAQMPLAIEQIHFMLRSWPSDLGLLQRLYRLQVAELEVREANITFGQMLEHEDLSSDWIITHANFLKEQRDYGKAVQVMHEALRRRPAPFGVYEQLLSLYPLSQPQLEAWHQFALRCVRFFPQEAVALYHAGLTSFYVGDTQMTIDHLKKCAQIASFHQPELLDLPFYHALGSAHLKKERWQEALTYFNQGILKLKGGPANLAADCLHGVSVSLMALAPENPLIEEFCRKAIETEDQEASYYLTLADWQIQQKQFSLAKETLEKARSISDLTEVERGSIQERIRSLP